MFAPHCGVSFAHYLRGRLGQVLLGVSLFEVGNVATTLFILRATQQLTPSLGLTHRTQVAIGLYIGYNIAATLASLPAGRLSDRWGASGVLVVGVLFLPLIAYLGFAVAFPECTHPGREFHPRGPRHRVYIETSQHASVADARSYQIVPVDHLLVYWQRYEVLAIS